MSALPSVNAASIEELPIIERMALDVALCNILSGSCELNKNLLGSVIFH